MPEILSKVRPLQRHGNKEAAGKEEGIRVEEGEYEHSRSSLGKDLEIRESWWSGLERSPFPFRSACLHLDRRSTGQACPSSSHLHPSSQPIGDLPPKLFRPWLEVSGAIEEEGHPSSTSKSINAATFLASSQGADVAPEPVFRYELQKKAKDGEDVDGGRVQWETDDNGSSDPHWSGNVELPIDSDSVDNESTGSVVPPARSSEFLQQASFSKRHQPSRS